MEGKLLPLALIAQSVERKAFNLVVVGSSPTESIYFFINNYINLFFSFKKTWKYFLKTCFIFFFMKSKMKFIIFIFSINDILFFHYIR